MSNLIFRLYRFIPNLTAPIALLSIQSTRLEFTDVYTSLHPAFREIPLIDEQKAFEPIFGCTAKLHVKGIAEYDHKQTVSAASEFSINVSILKCGFVFNVVVVEVTTKTGDSLEFEGTTVAALSTPADELKAGNSSVLLERLRASDKLHYILDDENKLKEWTGELPIFESKHLSLFRPFPAVEAW
ncbi:uncharacterized protein PHALS_06154 [Plasmopara halstedii]|uniref:Uncharacterized protein n=1 Tax=Plasmopara halstedii TaxID=4781 RepID=A0A0P1B3T4_PLAHL|nr:uncharacterized protein PHALS_06154 [Plasmopara halstedii]CEG48327.1 hypothetical protein PHALS_06154 [Plasmopara halstedii]|eukprot:XP_024584696.1 hypothetical protein PHALS_06154 [Plasmopara halstedii]